MPNRVETVKRQTAYIAAIVVGALMGALGVFLNVHNVKDEQGIVLFVLAAMVGTLAVVALTSSRSVRAHREHQEIASTLFLMSATLRTIGDANRRHADRLAGHAMTILLRLDERTRAFTTAERAQVMEVVEQIHAVQSILTDWQERATQNAPVVFEVRELTLALDSNALAEPAALLDLATDTLRGLVDPQDAGEVFITSHDEPLQAEPA